MILLAFSVYDSKVEAYMRPFFEPTKGSAVRSFSDACNEEGAQFQKHAEDYTLFHVGSFDDSSGVFASFASPISLGNALTFILKEE